MKNAVRILCLAVLVAGCADGSPLGPTATEVQHSIIGGGTNTESVRVLSWNIYIGTNVDAVILALASPDPADDVPALLGAIGTLQETAFPIRAKAIANKIALWRPHVIGLQEVSILDIDLRAAGLGVDFTLDYLTILQAALAARGLNYVVAGSVTNIDVNLTPAPGTFVKAVDRDVILVDPSRVEVLSSVERNYTANLPPLGPIEFVRGFVAVTAEIGDRTITFANTHLEPDLADASLAPLRAAQMAELLAAVTTATPAVLMGDFNDVPGSPMYDLVAGAGYDDVWAALRPRSEGLTCCHLSDLSNRRATLDQRIDYVFSRGLGFPKISPFGLIERLGEGPFDRIPGPAHPIWPSDHAGLAAILLNR